MKEIIVNFVETMITGTMNTVELKSDLHRLIDKINDATILNAVKVLLSKGATETDWWDEIGEEEKQAIEKGLAEADRGEVTPHEEVMKEVKAKYNLH